MGRPFARSIAGVLEIDNRRIHQLGPSIVERLLRIYGASQRWITPRLTLVENSFFSPCFNCPTFHKVTDVEVSRGGPHIGLSGDCVVVDCEVRVHHFRLLITVVSQRARMK